MDVSSFMGGNFLTHLDLPQPNQVWSIGTVDQQLVGQGKTAEQKICITFGEHHKPLAMNKTNLKRIAALYSTDANAWIGKQLLVYRSRTTFGNETVLCVRVCGPTQAPPDALCDAQGNAVQIQAAAQPAMAKPAAAAPSAPAAQPVAEPTPQTSAPWDQDDSSPPSA